MSWAACLTGSRGPGRSLAVACLLALLSACGSTVPVPTAPSSTPASSAPTDEYLIGPGDLLQVFVWREPELSTSVRVRPDGRISTPLVSDLVAAGKTPSQLATEIEGILSEYIRAPDVNVIVQEFVGTFGAQIRVIGQAAQPRSIPYRENMTLMDVIIEVGGLTEFAAGNRARVVRTTGGQRQEFRVRLDDLLNRGRLEENMLMRPGDIIIIPEAIF